LGRSVSVELGLNVNRSTSENTLVWRVALGVVVAGAEVVAGAFSLPRVVADENARKNPWGSFDAAEREEELRDATRLLDPAAGCPGREVGRLTLAGWKVARDL
jgi:hypothetical protein